MHAVAPGAPSCPRDARRIVIQYRKHSRGLDSVITTLQPPASLPSLPSLPSHRPHFTPTHHTTPHARAAPPLLVVLPRSRPPPWSLVDRRSFLGERVRKKGKGWDLGLFVRFLALASPRPPISPPKAQAQRPKPKLHAFVLSPDIKLQTLLLVPAAHHHPSRP